MNIDGLIQWFESLTPESLHSIDSYYTESCYFRDPFNEIRSRDELKHIFREMFKLESPRFKVLECIRDDEKAFLTWDFHFSIWGRQQNIHGGSVLHFSSDGRVNHHRDYWDAAEEVYEKIPALGGILRMIKKLF